MHHYKSWTEQVNLAYDQYFDAIQRARSTEAGIVPPSPRLVGQNPRTMKHCHGALWAVFQAKQDRLNDEFSDSMQAKHAKDVQG